MLEKMKYVNHLGETLEFGTFPLFVNQNDLRDFAWEITSKNDKIASFKKGITTKNLPVIIKCQSEEEGYSIRNKMFELFEKDVLVHKYGKICIGDYYLKCFITESKKTNYLLNNGYMTVDLTVKSDRPEWVKETEYVFSKQTESTAEHLDYSFDYSIDYSNGLVNGVIVNKSFVASNFRMIIYGEVSSPAIFISGHKYAVDVIVDDGEYLTIDSVEKTIVLTKKNGEKVNCFKHRRRDSYVFEKIPAGDNVFASPNESIYFDITLLDERSEPKWT